jgi:TFIIF-interacting CTD phosphatase-like protein
MTPVTDDPGPSRPLLVLDLDETLIYSVEDPLVRLADHRIGPFHVYRRPHLERFLTGAAEEYDLAVWSAATPDYVRAAVAAVVPRDIQLAFVWGRDRCTQRFDPEQMERYFVKDLKKVKRKGYSLSRMLIVEDTPQKVERQYGNAVYVTSWEGSPEDDDVLLLLLDYLRSIRAEQNFRTIEKRGWRSRSRATER